MRNGLLRESTAPAFFASNIGMSRWPAMKIDWKGGERSEHHSSLMPTAWLVQRICRPRKLSSRGSCGSDRHVLDHPKPRYKTPLPFATRALPTYSGAIGRGRLSLPVNQESFGCREASMFRIICAVTSASLIAGICTLAAEPSRMVEAGTERAMMPDRLDIGQPGSDCSLYAVAQLRTRAPARSQASRRARTCSAPVSPNDLGGSDRTVNRMSRS
jgi:hypothetical protein